jgi:NAD(P)-dependent dehydrogenase (short-subunit alcohol dehydrogenase family)
VTGASAGIGLATSRLFAQEGACVAMLARGEERLSAAASELARDHPKRVLPVSCDVLDEQAVQRAIERVQAEFGGVDILVNNAGAGRMSTFANTTDGHWHQELEIKFFSVIYPTRAVVPLMRARGGGRIVNINAILARQPEPYMVATSAARAGVLNLSRSLATELAPDNILVNSVALGLIESDQWRRRHQTDAPDRPLEEYLHEIAVDRDIPLGRLGKPEEVAGAIVFLCSGQATYITGATLEIGGGKNAYV